MWCCDLPLTKLAAHHKLPKRRTHKGSGERKITLELLRQVGHLPQQQAADQLNIGNTRFKVRLQNTITAEAPRFEDTFSTV